MLYQEREAKLEQLIALLSLHRIYCVSLGTMHTKSGDFLSFYLRLLNGHTIYYDPYDDPADGLAAAIMVHDLPTVTSRPQ